MFVQYTDLFCSLEMYVMYISISFQLYFESRNRKFTLKFAIAPSFILTAGPENFMLAIPQSVEEEVCPFIALLTGLFMSSQYTREVDKEVEK